MNRRNKARRPRQRTAHTLDGIPGLLAFYADSFTHSMVDGFAQLVRGRPHHIGAFGTIETRVRRCADRPVVLDARAVVGAPESVTRDGIDLGRCVVTLALMNGRVIRVGLDAPSDRVAELLRKAKG
jgi:hypothetical protein